MTAGHHGDPRCVTSRGRPDDITLPRRGTHLELIAVDGPFARPAAQDLRGTAPQRRGTDESQGPMGTRA